MKTVLATLLTAATLTLGACSVEDASNDPVSVEDRASEVDDFLDGEFTVSIGPDSQVDENLYVHVEDLEGGTLIVQVLGDLDTEGQTVQGRLDGRQFRNIRRAHDDDQGRRVMRRVPERERIGRHIVDGERPSLCGLRRVLADADISLPRFRANVRVALHFIARKHGVRPAEVLAYIEDEMASGCYERSSGECREEAAACHIRAPERPEAERAERPDPQRPERGERIEGRTETHRDTDGAVCRCNPQ